MIIEGIGIFGGKVIAKVAAGEKVHVLLAERYIESYDNLAPACGDGHEKNTENYPFGRENFLVRTSFGLIGWVPNKAGNISGVKGNPLSCIIQSGD